MLAFMQEHGCSLCFKVPLSFMFVLPLHVLYSDEIHQLAQEPI
jgi:hypothetical protein